ncbi:MAG: PHP-associated domain-containing protein [archaeon]
MVMKVDLHTHTSDFSHLIFTEVDKKKYLLKLLSKLYKKGDKLVVGVANFNNDGRYSKFVRATNELSEDYIVNLRNSNYFISIQKNNKIIYFVRADEIETDKGHILILGNKDKINSRNLKNLLKLARKNKWIVIADHPLHKIGLGYFLIQRIFGLKRWSLNDESIKKNKKDFDSIELNSYFPEDRDKIRKFAKKNNIPIIADSDAHCIKEFFDSYFEVENLNFKNIQKFKRSFRKALKKHVKIHAEKHGFLARYKHGFNALIFENWLRKLGLFIR